MKKKRIAVYLALVLAFALACSAHLIPKLTVRAYDYDPAEIGTATLADEGDTVFIRMGKFTFGEGDEAEEIVAPGFVVANAAAGENPAAGIDLTALTPITPEAPLTGTLDKNVYVCGGGECDLYLGDLKLAEGRKIYTDGTGLNLLGGKLEADAIETTGYIAIGSADVTVNSDLTGFSGIMLFVSHSNDEKVKGYDTPASLTVNGNVRNTGIYNDAAIDVAFGSAMTVTGDVYTEYPVVIHSNESYGKSTFNVGGSLTVKNSPWWGLQLVYADAVIGGDVNVDYYVQLNNSSALQAKSVTATRLAANNKSAFSIEENVTLSDFLDLSLCTKAQSYEIGGNLKCGTFNVVGPAANDKSTMHVGGNIEAGVFYMNNTVLDADGDLKKTGFGNFRCDSSEIDVAGNVSGSNFDLYLCDAAVHGNVTSTGNTSMPIKGSTLTVEGDMNCNKLDLMGSTVTVKGGLTNSGTFVVNSGYIFGVKTGSVLKVTGDVSQTGDLDVCNGSELQTDGALNVSGPVHLSTNGALDVKKDITSSTFSSNASRTQVGGSLTSNGYVGVHNGSALTVDGDMKANVLWPHAPCEVKGNVTVSAPVSLDKALKVGGDFDCSGYFFDVTGSKCEIGGDLKNVGQFDATFGADVKIGGSVLCDGANGDGLFTVMDSACEIGGDLQARTSLQSGKYNRGSALTVGGSATAGTWVHVAENCTADVAGDVTWNYGIQNLAGTLTVGGDFVNNAHSSGFQTWDGYFVSGLLDVAGDVRMNDVLLNYNDYEQNLAIGGRIIANRKTDVLMTIPNSVYVIGNTSFTTDEDEKSTMYSVPFDSQTAALTINGELYAMDVRDRGRKTYAPVRVSPANAVTYELNGGAFYADAVVETGYYTEIGLDMPDEKALEKRVGLLFGGWYDNADFEGDAITGIPEGTTGDVTVYLKWIECDHADSTVQSTCTESAVCTVCGGVIPLAPHSFTNYVPNGDVTCTTDGTKTAKCDNCDATDTIFDVAATGHTYGAPVWRWNGTKATATFACEKGDDTVVVNASVTKEVIRNATKMTNGLANCTAVVEFQGETYTDSGEKEFPYQPIQHKPCPICGALHDGNIIDNFIGLFHHMIDMFTRILTLNSIP